MRDSPARPGSLPRAAASRCSPSRGRIAPRVIYSAAAQPGWDMRPDWFAGDSAYPHETLRAWQRRRPGRSPLVLARGLGAALRRADPSCVVSSEFGPTTWRALAWCRRRRRPLVVFSELTPWSEPELSRAAAPHPSGAGAARWTASWWPAARAVERLARLGVDPARVEVALQSADLEPFAALPARAARRAAGAGPVRGPARAGQEPARADRRVRGGRLRGGRGRAGAGGHRPARGRAAPGGGRVGRARCGWPATPRRASCPRCTGGPTCWRW